MTPLDDHDWQPATFRERGVAVPFTSPALAGARARLTERRCDLVIPHPGGARGVYIIALSSMAEFCSPTLHDLQLKERIASLPTLSPSAVRLAAREIALEGAAGRAACSAAQQSALRDSKLQSTSELGLLQVFLHDQSVVAVAGSEQALADSVNKLACRTGRNADAVRADVGRLSNLLVSAGLALEGGEAGRCSALLDTLEGMRTGLLALAGPDGPGPAFAQMAFAVGAVSIIGRGLVTACQKMLADPPDLLAAWAAGPAEVAVKLCRPGWLLDGWEYVALLWQLAETDEQRAEAVVEACIVLPPLPLEVAHWPGPCAQLAAKSRGSHLGLGTTVQHGDGSHHGAGAQRSADMPSRIVSMIARNEHIRALAA